MRKAIALGALGVVASLASLAACTAAAPMSPRAPTPGDVAFHVETYNIHRYRSDDPPTVDAVGADGAEILVLEEVTDAWEAILRARYADAYPNMVFAPDEDAGGLAFLSKWPIEDDGVMHVPLSGKWHPAWVVKVATPAGPVQVLALHLRAMFDGASDYVDDFVDMGRDHVQEMDDFMAKLTLGVPTILAGDWNESPDGDAVKKCEGLGYANILPMFHPGQFTWHGASVGDAEELAVDHLLFDARFTPLDAYVVRRGNSDHYPVIAYLELPGQAHAEDAPLVVIGEPPGPRSAVFHAQHEPVIDTRADADGHVERPVEAARSEAR